MKARIVSILLLAAVSVNLTGCFAGRTKVIASQYASRPYDIYLDGKPVCRMGDDEDCTFQTRGTRAGGQLEAFLDGQRVGSIEVHRSMSFMSILFAPFTYTLSLWLYQAYPDEIEIPIDNYMMRYSTNNNNENSGISVWDRPYKVTKKVKKPTPVEPKTEPIDDAPYIETNDEPTAVQKSVWD